MEEINIHVKITGRDEIFALFKIDDQGQIIFSKVQAIGCLDCLNKVKDYKLLLKGHVLGLTLPTSSHHVDVLLREMILKLQKKWKFPYDEKELCHCRRVPTQVVDDEVISGAHSIERVGQLTQAGSSCGSCRHHIKRIISYRLGQKDDE